MVNTEEVKLGFGITMGEQNDLVELNYSGHSKALCDGVVGLYESKEWTDLLLNVSGNEYLVHTFMISIFAPKLISRCEEYRCNLPQCNIDQGTLTALLAFIYKGQVKVERDKLKTVRRGAELLGLNTLLDLIDKEIQEDRSIPEPQNQIIPAIISNKPLNVGKGAIFQCSRCEFKVEVIDDFQKHLNEVHGVNLDKGALKLSYKCRDCEFEGEDKQTVARHRKSAHCKRHERKAQTFKCCNCEFFAGKKWDVIRHLKSAHAAEKTFKCEKCDYSTTKAKYLQTHQTTMHNEGEYMCTACDRKFTTNAGRVLHHQMIHLHPEERNKCYLCSFKAKSTTELKQHLADEHNIRRKRIKRPVIYLEMQQCSHCDQILKNKTFLIDHLADKHRVDLDGNPIEPKYRCRSCEFVAYSHVQLYRHNYKLHSKVEFRCDHCPFKCRSRPILRDHVRWKHFGEKRYMCELCGARFSSSLSLSSHRKSHLTPKTDKEVKKLKRRGEGTENKPFSCNKCEKAFSQKAFLKQHVWHVHNENSRRHKCDLCPYAAKTKWNLGKHMRTVHKDVVSQMNIEDHEDVRETEIAVMEVETYELVVEEAELI